MPNSDPLENLLPSLIQSFSIIFLGYIAVRASLIQPNSTALGTYVTKFALPALFFRSMATINLQHVNWLFILAVSLGKLSLFIITILLTLLITRPVNFGMAGILSMFITQSNDVALGYPILLGLYPDLAKYIYLFAPTQLVFINPLCFVLLELHESRIEKLSMSASSHTPLTKRILLIIKNVILNPLVYMTIIGVIFNFILSHHLPLVIDKTLAILADTFGGVALFYLGMNMVDKLNAITKNGIYILVFILFGKLIFLPFLTREFVVHLVGIQLSDNQTLNYSLMGFLYGGLPTAPPVFLIAHDFNILSDVIATGLVVGTFLSGPLMFITGRVITMVIASRNEYDYILQSTAISMSTLSILGCIWVIIVFILSHRWKSPVHRITLCYITYILMLCLGLVIGRIVLPNNINENNSDPGWGNYIQFSVFFIGCTGARLWTCLITLSLTIIRRKGVGFLTKKMKLFYLFGFCTPVFITASILIFAVKQKKLDIDPSFQFGRIQLICSLIILLFSIIVTIFLLVLRVRFGFGYQCDSSTLIMDSSLDSYNNNEETRKILPSDDEDSPKKIFSDTDSLHHPNCRSLRNRCRENVNTENLRLFNSFNDDDFQIHRHTVLVMMLVVSMGAFLCLWRLIKETVSGIYIELEFLDCVFNFGQGFILWAVFGLDMKLIVMPCKRKISKLCNNIHKFYIPRERKTSTEISLIRNQFCTNHLEIFRNELPRKIRQNFVENDDVFTGKELVNWILKADLVESRLMALAYCQALLISHVIESVKRFNSFVDSDYYLYRIVDGPSDKQESGESEITDLIMNSEISSQQ